MLKVTYYRHIDDGMIIDEQLLVTDGTRTQCVHVWVDHNLIKHGEVRLSKGKIIRSWSIVKKAYDTYKPLADYPIDV